MLFSKSVSIQGFVVEVKNYIDNNYQNTSLNSNNLRTRLTGLILFLNNHIHI
jgi:hypothetical protein